MGDAQEMVEVTIEEARTTTTAALKKIGWDDEDAALQADIMINAELCGNNQGLVKMYNPAQMKPAAGVAKPSIERETATSAVINANGSPGMLAACTAADIAVRKLRTGNGPIVIACAYGTCTSSGQLAFYADRIARSGYIGIIMANSPELVSFARGSKAILGTNPIAFGIPRADAVPLTFDMATAAIAFFGVLTAKAKGEPLPEGVAFDNNGKSTTDADAVLNGDAALSTFGGHKGAGLSLMVELLSGVLAGGAVLGQCESKDAANSDGTTVIAIDPSLLTNDFERKVASTLAAVKASGEVILPGERSAATAAARRAANKLPVPKRIWDSIKTTASQGISKL